MTDSTPESPIESGVEPILSVVIPVGRVDPELDEQLVALAHQDITASWELVISLNTPDADQRIKLDAAIERFARLAGPTGPTVEIVDSSDVRSASHARNVGAAAASAELLAFCDGDDIADKAWASTILAALDEHAAVGGHLEETLLAVPGQENWRPPATPGDNPSFLGHPYLVSANMGLRKAAFEAAGGFDESLTRGEDIAFSWAMLRNGVVLGFRPDAVMHYRHRKGLRSMLHQHYLYGIGMSEILHRHGVPGDGGSSLLKANGQKVDNRSVVHVLRRGSIAVGRLVGLAQGELDKRRQSSFAANAVDAESSSSNITENR